MVRHEVWGTEGVRPGRACQPLFRLRPVLADKEALEHPGGGPLTASWNSRTGTDLRTGRRGGSGRGGRGPCGTLSGSRWAECPVGETGVEDNAGAVLRTGRTGKRKDQPMYIRSLQRPALLAWQLHSKELIVRGNQKLEEILQIWLVKMLLESERGQGISGGQG